MILDRFLLVSRNETVTIKIRQYMQSVASWFYENKYKMESWHRTISYDTYATVDIWT